MDTNKAVSKTTNITFAFPWFGIVLIPLLLPGPQILVGTLVNFFLFSQSKKLTTKKLILLAVLPSLAALGHGLLFGSFTVFLVYFLPFIWLGNWTLMAVNKKTGSFIYASFAKAFILTISAVFLINLKFVPSLFLTSMGLIQLITALAGGTINLAVFKKK